MLERERQRADSIQAIAAAVGSNLELDEVLGIIAAKMTSLLGAERATLFRLDEEGARLVSKVTGGKAPENIVSLSVEEGIAGWVVQNGRSINVKDAYQDPRFCPTWDKITGFRTRSLLCVPMRNVQRSIIGVVEVLNKKIGYFTTEDEDALAALAAQAAVTLENAALVIDISTKNARLQETQKDLERKIQEAEAVYEVQKVLHDNTDLEEMLQQVLERVTHTLEGEAGSVLISVEPWSHQLAFRAAVGPAAEAVRAISIEPGEGIIGWCAEHGEPVRVDDVASDHRHSHRISSAVEFAVDTEVAAPITDGAITLGAIGVFNKSDQRRFSKDDLKVLVHFGRQVGIALQRRIEQDARQKQQRLATIGKLFAGVLHDLRTPLTVISGCVQLMVKKEDSGDRKALADRVQRQFSVMDTMSRDVLAFVRGEKDILLRKVYVTPFVDELREELEAATANSPIHVTVESEDAGTMVIDETKVRRAIFNLCGNAIDAMTDGGKLSVRLLRDEGDIAVLVSDTGPGIPDDIHDVLFDSFVTHGKEDGTGLGLAIVLKIVEDHGGTIAFETEREVGTTFAFRLPQP